MTGERQALLPKLRAGLKEGLAALLPVVSDEASHHAHILVVSGYIFLVVGCLILVGQITLGLLGYPPASWTDLFMDFATALGGYVMIRSVYAGRIRFARLTALSGLCALAAMQLYWRGNPTTDCAGVLALQIYVLMAMILLDRPGRLLAMLSATAIYVGMVMLWGAGLLHQPPVPDTANDSFFSILIWITTSSIVAVLSISTTGILRHQTHELQNSVSDLRKLEANLRDSEERYRILVENLGEGIALMDMDERITFANKAAHEIFGLATGNLVDRSLREFVAPENEIVMTQQTMLRRFGRLGKYELEILRPNGERRSILFTTTPVALASKGETAALGVFRDITERVKTEMALRASEERFRAFSNAAHDAIITLNHEGNITYWNAAATRMFGYTAEEVTGTNLHTCIVPSHYHAAHRRGFETFLLSGRGPGIDNITEMTALHRDGSEFAVELSLSAFQTEGQWQAVGIIRDIGERKRIEETLKVHTEHLEEMVKERTQALQFAHEQMLRREKLAALGQLAGNVAHDLRNPLGAISNATYMLDMLLETPAPGVQQALDIQKQEVVNAQQIIDSLLNFARTKKPAMQMTDINTVVNASLVEVKIPDNPKIDVDCRLTEPLPLIEADPVLLVRVFTNLLLNALQAMPDGGKLTICSSTDLNAWVTVSIEDTGVGIPAENIHRLFQPLFTTKVKGVGLGLAMVKELVEKHGGTIDVASQVNIGTKFTIRLPVVCPSDGMPGDY